MGNPYFVERRSPWADTAQLGLRVLEMDQAGKIADTRSKLMQEDLALRSQGQKLQQQEHIQKYGGRLESGEVVQGTVPRQMSIMETQAQTERAKIPAHQRQFSIADSTLIRSGLAQQGLDKPMGRFLDTLDNMGKDPKYTKGQTYMYLKANWPAYQQMLVEDISKELQKTTDPMQAEKLTALLKGIGADQEGAILDAAMPETARAIQLENAAIQAKNSDPLMKEYGLAVQQGFKGTILDYKKQLAEASRAPVDQFSEPYKDETGTLLQRNTKTGEVRKIATPPQGWTIESDGQGGFRMVQGPQGSANLTTGAKTELQKDIVSVTDQLSALKPVLENYSSDLLTYYGKGKKFALNVASKAGVDIGEENRDFIQRARMVNEGLETVFNIYRKNITGAQAVMKELSMLRESILNKDLSPDEFNSSVKRFIELGQRSINLRMKLMEEEMSQKTINSALDDLVKPADKKKTIGRFTIEEE